MIRADLLSVSCFFVFVFLIRKVFPNGDGGAMISPGFLMRNDPPI